MVIITEAGERRSCRLRPWGARRRGPPATVFELFFDLVYVFAMTQVTGYMVHAHDALGVLQGLLVLALLWWTWCAYAWLGNQARADTGVSCVPPWPWRWRHARDAEGGLYGPLVLVGAYLIVRCVHLAVYGVTARGDPELSRQLAISWVPTLAGAVLLIAGVLLGGQWQTVFFAGALVGGFALYLAGHLLFKQRMYATFSVPRLVTVGVLLLALPAATFLPPLLGLAGLVLLLVVPIGVETRRYAALRADVPAE